MKSVAEKVEAPKFLSGWKEISNYLGRGVRTIQRYEREFGFPVRRPAGKSHGAVIATKAEVDAWVAASPIRRQFSLSRANVSSQRTTLEDLRIGMRTMSALRGQMQALRLELRVSVQGLSESIQGLYGEINNRGRSKLDLPDGYSRDFIALTDSSADTEFAAEALMRRRTPRKAS
jgi:hypothetical protein